MECYVGLTSESMALPRGYRADGVSVMVSGARMCWFSSIVFQDAVGAWMSAFHLSTNAAAVELEELVLCLAA